MNVNLSNIFLFFHNINMQQKEKVKINGKDSSKNVKKT